ncbi:MAG: T9SS type A sorting domain-containing protein [Bacteroidales bacterium]|nr:T9SS type A sorting domain-containing protein [Bacteroidales bacterium]
MKKSLTVIIGVLFCITANSQQIKINSVVTRQGESNNGWYQLSSQPSVVLGENNTISIVVNSVTKETYTLSDDNTLTILFGSAINEEVSASNLKVSYPILIQNGGILNVSGTMDNTEAENLVIEDGGQLITGSSVTATAMKHIKNTPASEDDQARSWYTISSPLAANTDVTGITNLIPSDGITNQDYDLYRFNEVAFSWENARPANGQNPDFTTIDKGIGYIYSNKATTDIAFAGNINVEDINVDLTLTTAKGNGYNLIGNPFMQNITLDDITTAPAEGLIVLDDKSDSFGLADGFYVLNNDNTWGTKPMTGEIKPLQGFLVQANESCKATISRPASGSKGERSDEQNTNIEMIVSNASFKDNAYAMFGEGTGLNKVSHRNAQAPMLYIPQGNEDFAIAFMNENTTVFPLNFKAMTTGNYSISLNATDDIRSLVLIDNMTGVETNMLLEDSYSFIGSPADKENRFTVKLAISHNDGQSDSEHFVYQSGSELVINGEGTLQIFDVLGRVVISEEVHGQTVNVGNLSTGAYIVRLTGESVMTQKIVVR